MKKRIVTIALVIALLAVCFGGTLAYLTDTDEKLNTMTMGKVSITQNEYERKVNDDGTYATDTIDNRTSYVLTEYVNDDYLYPAVIPNGGTVGGVTWNYDAIPVRMSQVSSHGGASVFNTPNAVDKFVTVTNDGLTDAYVRTLIAFEVGTATIVSEKFPNELLIASEIRADVATKNTNGESPWTYGFMDYVTIGTNKYLVYEVIYTGAKLSSGAWVHENGVLPAGETTYPSLCQIYMASRATNEDVAAIDGNKNGKFDVLVLSQAVQAEGFASAALALDTAFGDVTADTAAEWLANVQ